MDKGWSWVTMLAAFGAHFSVGGLQYTAGFMRFILLQNADENEKRYITWITSIYSGMVYFVGPIASLIVYKYGCRTSVIVGASLEVIGFIICFLVRDMWIYIIAYGFLAGIGSGLTYTAIVVLISFNFDRYLSIAAGVAVSGEGIGLIIMPIICNFIYERYGLQPTFLIIAGVTLQKWVLGALMRPSSFELDQLSKSRNSEKVNDENKFVNGKAFNTEKKKNDCEKVFCPGTISDVEPRIGSKKENNTSCFTVDEIKKPDYSNISEEELPPKNKMADMFVEFSHDDETKTNSSVKMAANLDEVENKTKTSNFCSIKGNPYLRVLKTRKFIFLLLGVLLYSVPEEIIYMMYPHYAFTNGSSQSEMSNLLSIIGIASTSARLLMGVTANSKIVDIYILFAMPFVILGVATLLLPLYVHAFIGRVFYALVFGLYDFGVYSVLNELVLKITGIDDLTAAFGFINLLKGTVGIFAPPLADAIKNYAQNSDASFVFAGGVYTTSLLMLVLLP